MALDESSSACFCFCGYHSWQEDSNVLRRRSEDEVSRSETATERRGTIVDKEF